MPQTKRDQTMAGIADQGCSGIADQSDFLALLHSHDELRRARHFVVLMVTDERFVNVVVAEELLRMARVLAGDLVGFAQSPQGAQGDVLEVSDRRAYEIQAAPSFR